MKVETGVIAAAGSGTRMLPVTLGYPKELLPIINKPALHLIVEEFIDSGLKKIIIITGENPRPLGRFDSDEAHRRPKGIRCSRGVSLLGASQLFDGHGDPGRRRRVYGLDFESTL